MEDKKIEEVILDEKAVFGVDIGPDFNDTVKPVIRKIKK